MATKKQSKKETKKQPAQEPKVVECKSVQDVIVAECDELKNILLAKNADYGNSALSYPGLIDVTPQAGILIRLEDKIRRLYSLREVDEPAVVEESFDDTIKDLAGYCILYLVSKSNIKINLEA